MVRDFSEKLEKDTGRMKRETSLVLVASFLMVSMTASTSVAGNNVTSFNVLGDSSVDCGENTLFYPILHHNLSLIPCYNGSDSTLLPHLLGNFCFSLSLVFTPFLDSCFF